MVRATKHLNISRRAVLAGATAAAAVPALASGAAAADHPDAELIRLGAELEKVRQQIAAADDRVQQICDSITPRDRFGVGSVRRTLEQALSDFCVEARLRKAEAESETARLGFDVDIEAADECRALLAEYFDRREAARHAADEAAGLDVREAEIEALENERNRLEDLIVATPAATIEGVMVKLRLWQSYSDVIFDSDQFDAKVVESAIAGLEKLAPIALPARS